MKERNNFQINDIAYSDTTNILCLKNNIFLKYWRPNSEDYYCRFYSTEKTDFFYIPIEDLYKHKRHEILYKMGVKYASGVMNQKSMNHNLLTLLKQYHEK
jgi:hypothetical protein